MPFNKELLDSATKQLGQLQTSIGNSIASRKKFYEPVVENWYKSLPYAFIATDSTGTKKVFNLPLNPSNINITTHFATNVIATIGGTVEEHAPQRYFDIAIQGTTGIAPQYFEEARTGPGLDTSISGRSSYTPEFSLSNLTGGFFAKTTGKLDNALNRARDIIGGSRKHESGVAISATGYAAFHNFYKFLLNSKFELSGGDSSSIPGIGSLIKSRAQPLRFLSYKDNQEYTCAILRFELTRSADNPMLYNYNIQLRAYALNNIGFESFQPIGDARNQLLGLSGDTSTLSKFKNKISGAKAGIAAVSGAFKSFGR